MNQDIFFYSEVPRWIPRTEEYRARPCALAQSHVSVPEPMAHPAFVTWIRKPLPRIVGCREVQS